MTEIAVRSPVRDGYVPALDGVRAIAVLAVFMLHLARAYFPGGALGVDIFFVLSAFLITGLLIAEFERTGRVLFGAFYLRRAFRLLPALLLWLVLASSIAIIGGEGEKVPWSAAGALFYFNDFQQAWTDRIAGTFNQSWSLSVEEQFYLVWPPLLVFVLLRLAPRTQRWFLQVSVLLAAGLAFTHPNYFLPSGHALPLVIGCWAAEQRARGCSPWVAAVIRQRWVASAACALFVFASIVVIPGWGTVVFLAVSVVTAALLLNITCARSTFVTDALGSPVPRWIGERSYGVYLYGLTLMHLVPIVFVGIELKLAAPVNVALTAIVVALSYRFVESPIRNWGRQWLKRRHSEATTAPQPAQPPVAP